MEDVKALCPPESDRLCRFSLSTAYKQNLLIFQNGPLEIIKTKTNFPLQTNSNPLQVYNAPCFNSVSTHSTEVRNEDMDILFPFAYYYLFFVFDTLRLQKILKLEIKFLCSFHVDRSPVMFSLVRLFNSLNSIQRLLVKIYLFQSPNLIFKYLGFDLQVDLNIFPCLLF